VTGRKRLWKSEARIIKSGIFKEITLSPSRIQFLDQLKTRLHEPILEMWKEWDEHEPRALYHFTNIEKLKKIVRSKMLWASDVLKLNDPTEFLYATEAANFVLKCRWSELPVNISDSFSPQGQVGLGRVWRIYVASLCARCDRLGLWWRYADSGNGVALEFSYSDIADIVQRTKQFAVIPMRYGRLPLLDATEFICDLGLTLAHEADLSFDEASEFWSEVCLRILNSLLRFKHPVYMEEQELRTISICDVAEPCFTRRQDEELIHYIELPIVQPALKRLITGPGVTTHTRKELRSFLDDNGFGLVELLSVNLPLR